MSCYRALRKTMCYMLENDRQHCTSIYNNNNNSNNYNNNYYANECRRSDVIFHRRAFVVLRVHTLINTHTHARARTRHQCILYIAIQTVNCQRFLTGVKGVSWALGPLPPPSPRRYPTCVYFAIDFWWRLILFSGCFFGLLRVIVAW